MATAPRVMPAPHLMMLPVMTTLSNGLRIATLEFPKAPLRACVTIGCGSRFDPDESPGMSCAIFRRAVLIHMGQSFDREVTSVLLDAEGENIVQPLKHLADFVLQTGYFENATMLAPSPTKPGEEKVHFISEKLHEIAFRNSPLGRFPSTPAESKITNEQIKSFVSTHYTAARTVVTVTGETLKHEEVVRNVKKFFMHLPSDPITFSQLVSKSPATFTASEVRMLDENQTLATFAIAFRGASTTDLDYITLKVIEKMIGSVNQVPADIEPGKNKGLIDQIVASLTKVPDDGSSELAKFIKINKLAKYMDACSDTFHETGLFSVIASAEPHCLDELAKAIMSSISKLCCHVREEDVDRAREQLRTSFIRGLFTTPVAADIGAQIIRHGRRIRVNEVLEQIKLVDAAAIKRVANRFFLDKDIAIVAMGPIKKLPDYDWFSASTRSRNY